MSATAACTQVKVPVRLTAMMRSQISGVMSSTASNDSMPALVTRISTGPELGADLRERGVDRRPVGDVDLDRQRRAARGRELVGGRLGGRAVAVEDGDAVAVGDEPSGDAEPDAGGATGDDRDPAHRAASTGSNSRCSLVRPRRIQVGS